MEEKMQVIGELKPAYVPDGLIEAVRAIAPISIWETGLYPSGKCFFIRRYQLGVEFQVSWEWHQGCSGVDFFDVSAVADLESHYPLGTTAKMSATEENVAAALLAVRRMVEAANG